MQKLRNRASAIDRRLITILLIVFVQMAGAAMILPILPLYARREFALSPAAITPLVSSFFLAQFLAGPYLGKLSDRHGRVPVLVLSQLGTAVSFVMLALAPTWHVLFAARILDGITGGNIIVAQAYITDVTPREKRTESLGYIFGIFGLGFVIGPALGGILAAALGARPPYLIAGAVAGLTALASWLVLDETVTPERREALERQEQVSLTPLTILQNYPLVLILGVGFIGQFALGMLQATFALYGEAVLFEGYSTDATNLGVGLLLASVGLGQFFTQIFLMRRMLARFGDAWLVIVGSLIRTVGLVIFAALAVPLWGAVASVLFAVGMGLLMPPLQSLATRTVADEQRGAVLGFYQSVVSLATIISTAVAGIIFNVNPTTPFWIGAVLSLAAVLPAVVLIRLFPRKRERTQAVPERPGMA